MSFTTPDRVRIFLNKPRLTPDEVATISLLISTVDGVIKNYCGWEILAKDYEKKFSYTPDAQGSSSELDLRVYPLNSVDSVVFNEVDYIASIELDKEEGIIYFALSSGLSFPSGSRNVEVTFNAGYVDAPSDLIHAASWLVAMYFSRVAAENIGVEEEKFNTISVTYDNTDLPPLVKRVLDRYRVLRIF